MRARTFAFLGVHGQAVFVQPATGIVMVQTAVNEAASSRQDPLPGQERDAFWRGVLESLGPSPTEEAGSVPSSASVREKKWKATPDENGR
jgi:hypothetical protein